jgi:hypothetical protein
MSNYFFNTHWGVRQRSNAPYFILFYWTIDSMSMMIKKVHEYNLITCLIPHLAKNGIAILHYADDILFLSNERFENARNFKFKLSLFEQMRGHKIIFAKSGAFTWVNVWNMERSTNKYLLVNMDLLH